MSRTRKGEREVCKEEEVKGEKEEEKEEELDEEQQA